MSNTCSGDALRGSTQTSAGGTAWSVAASAAAGCLHLEEYRPGSTGRDATGLAMQQLAEPSSAARDGKVGFGIFQLDRAGAALPGRDLVEQALAQNRGVQRTAVEQDGIHARAVAKEIGQMVRDRAVGRVGQAPVAQTRLGAIGPGARIADRKKPVQHQALDLSRASVAVCAPATRLDPRPGSATMYCSCAEAGPRERMLFQVSARRDEVIPLRAGHPAAFHHQPRFEQHRERQIDIVAAQQDMFADRHPPDVGQRARRAGSQLEQAEIRGASADIDDQDVPLASGCRVPVPSHNGSAAPCCSSQQ